MKAFLLTVIVCLYVQCVSARRRVKINNPVTVNRGRSVFLNQQTDLQIEYEQGDVCTLIVLRNNPTEQLIGAITRDEFPCNYPNDTIEYIHFGALSPTTDRVALQAIIHSDTETVIIPVTLQIKVAFIQLEIVNNIRPLVVPNPGGFSDSIDSSKLDFLYNSSTTECLLTLLIQPNGIPRYGELINADTNGFMQDCMEFLNAGVRYQHTRPPSPNRDYIPVVVELRDIATRALTNKEYFQIPVIIRNAQANHIPTKSLTALYVLEVHQFVLTAITQDIIGAEDDETPAGELVFNITLPLGVGEGFIASTDDRDLPLQAFRQQDVMDLKIVYSPPTDDSNTKRIFEIEVVVIDTEGAVSASFPVIIIVNPKNTLAPLVTRNKGLTMFEAQRRAFTRHVLIISDEDNLDDVVVTAINGPHHGTLFIDDGLGNVVVTKSFTIYDLRHGHFHYQHDGSDTYSDNIIFQMSDGQHDVSFLFPITISPVDDEHPHLTANVLLQLKEGQTVPITVYYLSATDVDSQDSLITFNLELTGLPQSGQLLYRQREVPNPLTGFTYVDGYYEKTIVSFTQQDLLDGRIFYRHNGSESFTDEFRFKVQDVNKPPNQSPILIFNIKVQKVDDLTPSLVPGKPLRMVVEGRAKVLLGDYILYTDIDTKDDDLIYNITRGLTLVGESGNAGVLVFTDRPTRVVTTFTQKQLKHGKIMYIPPISEQGTGQKQVEFMFSVSDTAGNTLHGQKFTITLMGRTAPTVVTETVATNIIPTVRAGMLVVIDGEFLAAYRIDTSSPGVYYVVTTLPDNGVIYRNGVPLRIGDQFSLDDVNNSRITYHFTGSQSTGVFQLTVTNGNISQIFVVRPQVSIQDVTPPFVVHVNPVSVFEGGTTQITLDILQTSDIDSNDMRLRYIVAQRPIHGDIQVNGVVSDSFTQLDVANGLVTYVHTGGEIGALKISDLVVLNVTDDSADVPGGNRLDGVELVVTILPIDNQSPVVIVIPGFTVIEGGRSRITFDNLTIVDLDTDIGSIVCRITALPTEGYVENQSPVEGGEKSRQGKPISTFTIQDVLDGFIYYVQQVDRPNHEPLLDRFTMVCGDTGNNKAAPVNFDIIVLPENDEVPKIFVEPFVVTEGGSLPVIPTRLRATDGDIPAQTLTFVITKQPDNGEIIEQTSLGNLRIISFTMDQISATPYKIYYVHDGTETTIDTFSVVVTDGKYEVPKTITITVLPVDDETPRLKHNKGVNVRRLGAHEIIQKRLLTATDIDTEDETIMYLLRVLPRMGYLQLLVGSTWHNLTVFQNFTQGHINENRVRFFSNGKDGGRDKFKFDLTDGSNTFMDREFIINIPEVDGTPPVLRIRPITATENGVFVISTDYLHAVDQNTPDHTIKYTIVQASRYGRIENSDRPGVPVTMFTQLDLAGNKIRYIHTSSGEERMDTAQVRATDGSNDVLGTLIFMISGTDDSLPVVFNNGLTVDEGKSKWITPFELRAEDADTSPGKIIFTIIQQPMHGRIRIKGTRVREFTQLDIDQNFVTYEHDGTDTTQDDFQFTVSDSTNREFFASVSSRHPTRRAQTFVITVNPIDDERPKIMKLRPITGLIIGGSGGGHIHELSSTEIGYCFSSDGLQVADPDSDAEQLRYVIVQQPQFGYIRKGNASVSEFTQADVNARLACYVLTNRNASSDAFMFQVIDTAGNALYNQRLRLDWSYVSFASVQYEVKEDAGFLLVTLRRRGDLNSNAFVSITAFSGSAEIGVDFNPGLSGQVHFAIGVIENTWRVEIINDNQYERSESFRVELSSPVDTVLEAPTRTIVTIIDQDDEPTLSFGKAKYSVEEDVGELLITVYRTGDSVLETSVVCSTVPSSASGTNPFTVESKSDFITRPDGAPSSIIEFHGGETEKECRILIIDDSFNEGDETFTVKLLSVAGSRIGEINQTKVTIRTDASDTPSFQFAQREYHVDESGDYVTVRILREGTDFSQPASVQIATARSRPESAKPRVDYLPVSRVLEFAPGVTEMRVDITIIDDTNNPVLEGIETFEARLLMPMNAVLGSPHKAIIYINDSVSDRPQFGFQDASVTVNENDGSVSVVVVRTGDLSSQATVRCYTRQSSAQVMMDFADRPNSDSSVLTFLPGERTKLCTVELMDDTLEEDDEVFRLRLSEADSPDLGGADIGTQHTILITVKDFGDKTVIGFKDTRLLVREPSTPGSITYANLTILRHGDTSRRSEVTVYTEDTQAQSGLDYIAFTKRIVFESNVSHAIVSIRILPDNVAEGRESFKVRIGNDLAGRAEVKPATAHVFIDDANSGPSSSNFRGTPVFPLRPEVVSLQDYDDVASAGAPDPGYPVVCISSCNPRHSRYAMSGPSCEVDDSKTRYEWMVAGKDTDLVRLTSGTFFAGVNSMVLDSIYLSAGGRVQCTAIPVISDSDGDVIGIPSESDIVSISQDDGPCPRYDDSEVGAEPFSAQMSYIGPEDPSHPNMVKVVVQIPHYNGLLPVVSTQQPTNYDILFSESGFRVGSHPCSNLLMPSEYTTTTNFVTNRTTNEEAQGDILSYQYDMKMRSEPTLQFYRSLDLQRCMWTFESYYNMSEVVEKCGGTVATVDTIRDNTQSHLDVILPLHVGYAYFSPSSPDSWTTFGHDTSMKMSFVYDTQVLWDRGIAMADQPGQLGQQGQEGLPLGADASSLHPQRIYIDEDGKLRVTVRSRAGFRGLFILDHAGDNSMVMSKNYPTRQFSLELLYSDAKVVDAEQVWRLSSLLTLPDYTDTYVIKLIPCYVAQGVGYSNPLNCNPGEKMTFELPLRFQQTTNPVDAQYRLNTQFYIVNKEATWLMDSTGDFGSDLDKVFSPNGQVYGRLQVNPSQSLGSAYNLKLEKVYVCAGRKGYIPRYDPNNGHYGCIRARPELLYTKKIIDTRQPDTADDSLGGVPFNARLASEVDGASPITSDSNVDGFQFDVRPLYLNPANADNFVHTIYRFSSNKRSVHHVIQSSRVQRDINGDLQQDEGTGMQMIRLVPQTPGDRMGTEEDAIRYYEKSNPLEINPNDDSGSGRSSNYEKSNPLDDAVETDDSGSSPSSIPIIAAVCGSLVVILLVIIIVVVVRRRRSSTLAISEPPKNSSASTSAASPPDDNTEV